MSDPLTEAAAELAQLRAQVTKLAQDLQSAEVRIGVLISGQNTLRRERDTLRDELSRANAQHKSEIDRMLDDVAAARLRADQATTDATAAAQRTADAERDIRGLKAQIADLLPTKARLVQIEPLWQAYQEVADYLFQGTINEPTALLPGFLRLGASKSEGMLRLGQKYKRAIAALTAAGFTDTPAGWARPDTSTADAARTKQLTDLAERATKAENAIARIRAITLGG